MHCRVVQSSRWLRKHQGFISNSPPFDIFPGSPSSRFAVLRAIPKNSSPSAPRSEKREQPPESSSPHRHGLLNGEQVLIGCRRRGTYLIHNFADFGIMSDDRRLCTSGNTYFSFTFWFSSTNSSLYLLQGLIFIIFYFPNQLFPWIQLVTTGICLIASLILIVHVRQIIWGATMCFHSLSFSLKPDQIQATMNQRSEVKCEIQEIKTGLGPSGFNQLSRNTDSQITPNRRDLFLVPSLSQRDIFGVRLSSLWYRRHSRFWGVTNIQRLLKTKYKSVRKKQFDYDMLESVRYSRERATKAKRCVRKKEWSRSLIIISKCSWNNTGIIWGYGELHH